MNITHCISVSFLFLQIKYKLDSKVGQHLFDISIKELIHTNIKLNVRLNINLCLLK